MAELQRSALSFRRQGSSGLVWDDKFLGELDKISQEQDQLKKDQLKKDKNGENSSQLEQDNDKVEPKLAISVERSRSTGGRTFRTGKVSPAIDPPSPRVSACGFCSALGKREKKNRRRKPKSAKLVK